MLVEQISYKFLIAMIGICLCVLGGSYWVLWNENRILTKEIENYSLAIEELKIQVKSLAHAANENAVAYADIALKSGKNIDPTKVTTIRIKEKGNEKNTYNDTNISYELYRLYEQKTRADKDRDSTSTLSSPTSRKTK